MYMNCCIDVAVLGKGRLIWSPLYLAQSLSAHVLKFPGEKGSIIDRGFHRYIITYPDFNFTLL